MLDDVGWCWMMLACWMTAPCRQCRQSQALSPWIHTLKAGAAQRWKRKGTSKIASLKQFIGPGRARTRRVISCLWSKGNSKQLEHKTIKHDKTDKTMIKLNTKKNKEEMWNRFHIYCEIPVRRRSQSDGCEIRNDRILLPSEELGTSIVNFENGRNEKAPTKCPKACPMACPMATKNTHLNRLELLWTDLPICNDGQSSVMTCKEQKQRKQGQK